MVEHNPRNYSKTAYIGGWHDELSMQCRINDLMRKEKLKREKKELRKQKIKRFFSFFSKI